MLRASPLVALALAALAFGAPRAAAAHSLFVNPPPLSADDNAKSGPCGCYFGAAPESPADDATTSKCAAAYTTTELVAGSKLTVTWKETVNHDGKFRIAFAPIPVDSVVKADLDTGVLYEQPDTNSVAGKTLSATITVPDQPCASCTLQLRQLMTGSSNPYYWSCAAIKIVPADSGTTGAGAGGAGGAGGSGGAGGAGEGGSTSSSKTGSGGPESTAAGEAVPPIPLKTGACAAAPSREDARTGAAWLAAALALTLGARRRAHRVK